MRHQQTEDHFMGSFYYNKTISRPSDVGVTRFFGVIGCRWDNLGEERRYTCLYMEAYGLSALQAEPMSSTLRIEDQPKTNRRGRKQTAASTITVSQVKSFKLVDCHHKLFRTQKINFSIRNIHLKIYKKMTLTPLQQD